MNHKDPILKVSGLHYQWSKNSKNVLLKDLSFQLLRGEILTLIGPNGSGKSTLLKALSGILPLNDLTRFADVRYLGTDFLKIPPSRKARAIAYVAADLVAEFPMTAEEVVSLGRACQNQGLLSRLIDGDREKIRNAMELCLCWKLRYRRFESLSGGERQLVALASALAQEPKIICLDESLSKMDINHQISISRILKELAKNQGLSVIWVSHDINLALEWADRAIVLFEGNLVAQGPLMETITDELLNKVYPGGYWKVGLNPLTGKPKVFLAAIS